MFERILVVTRLTLLEEVRSKVLNATFIFAGVLVYFGLVLTNLAQGFEDHFFRDVAFALLEFFGLVILLQATYRVVRQDVRKGSSVEMLFVRPLRRWEYLAGRYFGIAALLLAGLGVMAGTLAGLIAAKGFLWHWIYFAVFLEIFLKLLIIQAAAFVVAIVTTSQASYLTASLLIYASAHVIHLLKALLERQEASGLLTSILVKPLAYLLPNFSLFSTGNHLDGILGSAIIFSGAELAFSCLYAMGYAAAALSIASWFFSRSEAAP